MLTKPIINNILFFVFMYALGALCINTTAGSDYFPFFIKLLFELFFDLYVICCLLVFLPKHLRLLSSCLLSIFLYLIAIVDLFCIVRFGTTISPSILQLVMETNTMEAHEFLSSYVSPNILISPVGYVILLMLIHIVISYFTKVTSLFAKITIKSKKKNITINGIVLLLLLVGLFAGLKNKRNIFNTWKLDSMGKVEVFFASDYYNRRAQYLPIHRLAFAVHTINLTRQELVTLQHTIYKTRIDSCKYTSPNIILIIGESYNKHHSQLYGYSQKTTPYQLHRKQANELYVFTNAVTPYNLTSDVLKNSFSLNDLTKGESWCEKPLFTGIFKKAGYQVTFLSNQFVMKQQSNLYDFCGGVFLNNPSLSDYQFDIRNSKTHEYDEGLIDDFHTLCDKKASNHRLIIFSLIGQHVTYADRFPSNYTRLHTSDYQRYDLNNEQLQIVVDYDNATLYNDYVINKIIQLFEQEDAIVIYMPDHGDECYDQIMTYGRLHCDPITKDIATNEFQIPFWIWCSKKYNDLHPSIVKQISQSTDRRFYSDDLPHLLLYLGGIYCQDYHDENNVISSSYNNQRKRILRKNTNYDEIIK